MIDPERVEHGRMQVMNRDAVLHGLETELLWNHHRLSYHKRLRDLEDRANPSLYLKVPLCLE